MDAAAEPYLAPVWLTWKPCSGSPLEKQDKGKVGKYDELNRLWTDDQNDRGNFVRRTAGWQIVERIRFDVGKKVSEEITCLLHLVSFRFLLRFLIGFYSFIVPFSFRSRERY